MSYDDLIGIPYRLKGTSRDGADCWGLLGLILGFPPEQVKEWRKVDKPRHGLVGLFHMPDKRTHVGYLINPVDMLHTRPRIGSCIESWDPYAQYLEGFYKIEVHRDLPSK